uniref:Uncharacterized protein n=1 Tax=Chromera velia CCMP2878 TaxID=1169474 RepID=A0A0G4F5V2_9ALVE|eukprot:Cvel_2770.t1-p1 / transcript=Cvel_2770.t1 / gene=Cvel_2770 / organism=Chromera_velia_CCMP2878 / gene_product=hypothetical protein / transcript_product=hypothetical protein / location=Cvel_scaffold111:64990-67428(+) / protein_length=501 / sequence_SO=supercontig / SO=protein_coding / is_pseudo=false
MGSPAASPVWEGESGDEAVFRRAPSQEALKTFVKTFGKKVRVLTVQEEDWANSKSLDLGEIPPLPNLKKLHIVGVGHVRVALNAKTAPELEELRLFGVERVQTFTLRLPNLRALYAEHCFLDASPGAFGRALTNCPKLQTVKAYKFRGLDGKNLCILPECRILYLHRSELTTQLEIVFAPRLRRLSIRASYELKHLRVWDLPGVSLKEMDEWGKKRAQAIREATETQKEEQKKWMSGVYGKDEAVRRGWCGADEEWKIDSHTKFPLEEHYKAKKKQQVTKAVEVFNRSWEDFAAAHRAEAASSSSSSSQAAPSPSRCLVNVLNVTLSRETKEHLRNHPRLVPVSDEDFEEVDSEGDGENGAGVPREGNVPEMEEEEDFYDRELRAFRESDRPMDPRLDSHMRTIALRMELHSRLEKGLEVSDELIDRVTETRMPGPGKKRRRGEHPAESSASGASASSGSQSARARQGGEGEEERPVSFLRRDMKEESEDEDEAMDGADDE